MLCNEQIVIFGLPKWEGDYQKSTILLAKELAKTNQVLYVDYPFTVLDCARGVMGKPHIPNKNIFGLKKRLSTIHSSESGGLYLFRLPPIIPMNWVENEQKYESIARCNTKIILPSLRRTLRQIGFTQPIIINAFLPGLGIPLKGQFNEKLLVYYCYDDIGNAPWLKKYGLNQECQFIKDIDLVVTTSSQLYKLKKWHAKDIDLVKNGVDFSLFEGVKLPDILTLNEAGKKINIGYIGSLDTRIDLDLLCFLIKELPACQFSFVGRVVDKNIEYQLRRFPNVKIVGPQALDTLPAFIEQFDIGIIPFLKNDLTKAIYPLKVNEYLARAKPVVSTDFADLSEFAQVIDICASKETFLTALQHTLQTESHELKAQRKEIAQNNSWENRGKQLAKILNRKLMTKKRKELTENRIN